MTNDDHNNLVHDMNRQIGTMQATLEQNHEIHSANAKQIEKVGDLATQILVQTTKTNGRVSSLEKTTEQLAIIISRQDGFILDGQRRLEKAINDGLETKRIVNELTKQRLEHDQEVRDQFEEAQKERKKLHWTTMEFWVTQRNKIILWAILGMIGLGIWAASGVNITQIILKIFP